MQSSFLNRLFWGIVLVGIGIVFLLNQTGLVSISIGELFADYWPVILIVFGLQGLLLQRSSGFVWNMIVIVVGVVFLGRNLGLLDWSLQQLFSLIGPVVLILFGIGMIFRGSKPCKPRDKEYPNSYGWNPVTPPPPMPKDTPQGPPPAPPLTDDPGASFSDPVHQPYGEPPVPPHDRAYPDPRAARDRLRQMREQIREQRKQHRWEHGKRQEWWSHDPNAAQHHRFIGDIHIGQDYWELRPMNISHFIGDTTLDLTKAQIPVGETKIYVSCFIGDVKVFVPNDPGIGIQVVSSSLIGDVRVWDQKRGGLFNHMSVESPSYMDTDKRVVLIASAFIGDVRVTKVG